MSPTRLNIGSADRGLRVLIGVIAIAVAFIGPKSAWGYLGLIPLATAAIGYCPLYAMLGLTTRPGTRT